MAKNKKGKKLIETMVQTINHFFPQLWVRIHQIVDPRKKILKYKIAEIITAAATGTQKTSAMNTPQANRKEKIILKAFWRKPVCLIVTGHNHDNGVRISHDCLVDDR